MRVVKRFGLLLAVKDSEHVKNVYGGYFNVFMSAFGEAGETWEVFRVYEGEFPKKMHLHRYDGFVISGSPQDAHGDEKWVLKLCSLLQTLYAMNKKLLGLCFGHQVICRALGGRVGRSNHGWDLGVRRICMIMRLRRRRSTATTAGGDEGEGEGEGEDDDEDHGNKLYLLQEGGRSADLSIIECHQDEVVELPPGAQLLAASDATEVEMFAMGTNILGFQGHPEYTVDILNDIVTRLVAGGSISGDFGEAVKLELMNVEPDTKELQQVCRDFLKGRLSFSSVGLEQVDDDQGVNCKSLN